MATWHAFFGGLNAALVLASGTSLTTVLISVERYFVVGLPTNYGQWFTRTRNRCILVAIGVFGILLDIPRVTSYHVTRNMLGSDFESLEGVEYIIEATAMEVYCYKWLGGLHDIIQFYVPVPALIVFNSLVYYHVRFQS